MRKAASRPISLRLSTTECPLHPCVTVLSTQPAENSSWEGWFSGFSFTTLSPTLHCSVFHWSLFITGAGPQVSGYQVCYEPVKTLLLPSRISCMLPLPEKLTVIQVFRNQRDRNRDLGSLEKIVLCKKIPRRYNNVFIEIFLIILKLRLTSLRKKECSSMLTWAWMQTHSQCQFAQSHRDCDGSSLV